MGLFEFLRDTAKDTFLSAAKLLPGIGPAVEGMQMSRELLDTIQFLREHRDTLTNLSMDVSELVSVAQKLLPAAKKTDIIEAGLQTVMGMQVLCGWTNEATRGDGYAEGGRTFNDIADTLESANPTDDWVGPASDAYTSANKTQYDRAKTMVDADFAISGALSAEAGQVNTTRRMLNNAATQMGLAIMPALLAKKVGGETW